MLPSQDRLSASPDAFAPETSPSPSESSNGAPRVNCAPPDVRFDDSPASPTDLLDTANLAFAPFAERAKEWRARVRAELGGELSAAVEAALDSAAWELGVSRWLADQGVNRGNPETMLRAAELAAFSRRSLDDARCLVREGR